MVGAMGTSSTAVAGISKPIKPGPDSGWTRPSSKSKLIELGFLGMPVGVASLINTGILLTSNCAILPSMHSPPEPLPTVTDLDAW